jgi:arylsulfatase A-like enzyme
VSSLDFFPTVAALAGAPMPQAREFDGVDLAALLFAPDKERTNSSAHAQLFHPLSGACGSGTLMATRIGRHKALWISGGAAACGDVKAECITHDPPLLFDLDEDPAESRPLNPTTAPNRALVQRLTEARALKLANIMGSPRSTADYSTSAAGRAANCCNAKNVDCACNSTVCEATPRRFALCLGFRFFRFFCTQKTDRMRLLGTV